jgi:hypothetical protein
MNPEPITWKLVARRAIPLVAVMVYAVVSLLCMDRP